MAEIVVIQSKVRELVKKQKMNLGGDLVPELSKAVESMVKKACDRADKNNRKTVQARDL